jgi:hypothetical protein
MLSGGGACTAGARPPRRGSAAAHGGEGTPLAAGPREARSYLQEQEQQHFSVFLRNSSGCSQQRHVELPHLHSQKQTLSAASRVEQA